MASPTTLFFAGVDIRTLSGVAVNDISGVYAPMTRRGDFDTIPGRDGQLGAQLPFDAYQFSVPVTVYGDTEAEMHAALAALGAALVGTGGLGELRRRLAAENSDGYVEHTASGAFNGCSGFSRADDMTLQCDLLFTNLDGGWKRSSDNVWVRP